MTFLIVDDSETTREIIIKDLKSFGFDSFYEADDGEGALKILEESFVDFVITDWNMPKMSGLELSLKIRNDELLKHLPILMLTSRGDKSDILDAMKAKVNHYLIKPFKPEVLMKKINEVLINNLL